MQVGSTNGNGWVLLNFVEFTARDRGELLKLDNAKLQQSLVDAGEELNQLKKRLAQQELDFIGRQKDNGLKIK